METTQIQQIIDICKRAIQKINNTLSGEKRIEEERLANAILQSVQREGNFSNIKKDKKAITLINNFLIKYNEI
jgi:hypothetical protein